jgi:large subunit ribosomal protein L15
MTVDLSNLKPPPGAHRGKKRLGRGPGSGTGKTSARGHKGQYSRSGSKHRAHKEGGQMPLYRRLPKRGFWNPFRVEYQVVNLSDLAEIADVSTIDTDLLLKLRLARSRQKPVKILGDGDLTRAVAVIAHAFTKSAREKISAAGGSCEVIEFKALTAGNAVNAGAKAQG